MRKWGLSTEEGRALPGQRGLALGALRGERVLHKAREKVGSAESRKVEGTAQGNGRRLFIWQGRTGLGTHHREEDL